MEKPMSVTPERTAQIISVIEAVHAQPPAPELLRLICKRKGTGRTALVTDSLALAGTDVTPGCMQRTQ